MSNVSPASIAALLRQLGLIEPDYNGPVEVTASTDDGAETIKINV